MVDFQRGDAIPPLAADGGGGSADAEGDAPDHPVSDNQPSESDDGHDDVEHDHHAHDLDTAAVAVVTVSSSRTLADDPAGDAVADSLEGEGHEVVTRELVNDDYDGVQSAVDALAARADVDAVVTTGGTGVTPDDVTPEAVAPLFEKDLPGVGELFRALSREEVGSRVVATRAVGGIADGVPVFCLPGSESAARLGTVEIVAPEVGHLAGLAGPSGDADGSAAADAEE